MSEGDLGRYQSMRDFSATPEPAGEPEGTGGGQRFVVQEHHARRLHWDFRLERGGVLVSWAVPKGIPPDPKVNHLAVHTEDHPLSYAEFEGEIPRGNYGAGKVTIWDRGTYECEKWDDDEVMVVLHGERVQGRYVLFRTRGDDWMMHRMDPPQDPDRQPLPEGMVPMEAVAGPLPDDDAAHGYEILWDGIRLLAYGEGGRVRLIRRGDDVTGWFPELARLGRALGSHEVVLDGVMVVLGDGAEPDRRRLERRLVASEASETSARRAAGRDPAVFMQFDVVHLDGRAVAGLSYVERRERLEGLELTGPHWQTPSYHVGEGAALLELARQRNLPGVVAKRLESPYEPGARSGDWIEVRVQS